MLHATLEDLLALRDGEAAELTQQHVEACERCRAELERLYQVQARLKAMPVRRPPRDRWPAVRAAALARRRRRRRVRAGWVSLAAAASLLLLVGGRAMLQLRQTLQAEAAIAAQITDIRERSQLLDSELRAYAPEQRVVSGWMAEAIIELEDGIDQLDAELGRAVAQRRPTAEMLDLWRQRIELQGALVNVQVVRAPARGF